MAITNLSTINKLRTQAATGDGCFISFNAAFVKYHRRLPRTHTGDFQCGLSRFFYQGGPDWSSPTLVAREHVPDNLIKHQLPH